MRTGSVVVFLVAKTECHSVDLEAFVETLIDDRGLVFFFQFRRVAFC